MLDTARRAPLTLDPLSPEVPNTSGAQVRVGIGLTLYNNARFLTGALDSLLTQTFTSFSIILVDDHSVDDTEAIARQYVARDPRLRYHRNKSRLGLVGSWRRAFEIVREECPSAPYFAWASDHDLWAPTWLETLVRALDTHPDVLLAYPWTLKLTDTDEVKEQPERSRFDTRGVTDLRERWALMCRQLIGAGNMVYGVMRADAVERAGIFRNVILPDRLLMAELTLQGQVMQVPEVLWFRRETGVSSIARQRRSLFGARRPPLHAYLPWPLTHSAHLIANSWSGNGIPRLGVGMCARYLATQTHILYQKNVLQRKREQAALAVKRREREKRRHRRDRRAMPDRRPLESGVGGSWLDRKLASGVVKPLAELFSAELAEARRARKALKGIHEEMSEGMSALTAQNQKLLAMQERLAVAFGHEPVQTSSSTGDAISDRDAVAPLTPRQLPPPRAVHPTWVSRQSDSDERFQQLARQVVQDGRTILSPERLLVLWEAVRNVHHLGLPAAAVTCDRGGGSYFLASAFAAFLGREIEFHLFGAPSEKARDLGTMRDSAATLPADAAFADLRTYLTAFDNLTVHHASMLGRDDVAPKRLSLVHIDTVSYPATLNALIFFGPRLTRGGVIVVNDVGAPQFPRVSEAARMVLQNAKSYFLWPLPSEQALLVKVGDDGPTELPSPVG